MIAYAGSLSGSWVYEDRAIPQMALSSDVRPRWLTYQSYALTTARFGPDPSIARAVSLAWHLVNGVLVWLVTRAVVSAPVSALGAGLFLLWPVQTEAVASVAYRGELVAATWLLLALLCSSHGWRSAAWICAAAAITGKEAGIIALALVPLWASWTGPQWTRRQVIAWGAASLALVIAGLIWAQSHAFRLTVSVDEIGAAIAITGQLLALGVWSVVDSRVLSIDHDWRGLTALHGVAMLGWAVAIYLAGSVWVRRALIWIGVALSLRILAPSSERHEHHLYTAWIGVSLAIAHLIGVTAWNIANIRARYTESMGVRGVWGPLLSKRTHWPRAGRSCPSSI